jgi:hypothetical protein
MVTTADRIILFPVKQEMKKVAIGEILDFAMSDNGRIYYFTKYGLFRSDPGSEAVKKVSAYSDWPRDIIGKKFSPENDRLMYFDQNKICVISFETGRSNAKGADASTVEEIFSSPDPLIDVFWYPGSGYIMAVSDKDIKVIELREGVPNRNVVTMYKFNSKPKGVRYDDGSGVLYFMDKKPDGASDEDRLLYKVELKESFFDNMMRILVKKETDAGYEKR